jgi:hypothetical protein
VGLWPVREHCSPSSYDCLICEISIHEDNRVSAINRTFSNEIKLALVLALWNGQRQDDLLRLPWSSYDGSHVRFRQSKTGRRVTMPAGMPLKVLLDGTERRSPRARADVTGLTFHDLRRSAVVPLGAC